MDKLKRTPLHDVYGRYGGRVVNFGGWALPVQYTGIIEEHRAVREAAGLFDVSHMGEIEIKGEEAGAFLQHILTNDIEKLQGGQVQYSFLCNTRGGVVDDLLVYCLPDRFILVVNAANTAKDFEWIGRAAKGFAAEVRDISDETAQLALQGPRSLEVLSNLTDHDLGGISYYWCVPGVTVAGVRCLVSRTGYTGEDGFELYCPPGDAVKLWERIMETGQPLGLVPVGLGARDTLRLEACMPLYGHELDEETTPFEAGLGRFVALDKTPFTGRDALVEQQAHGVSRRLIAFAMVERGVPRHGYEVTIGGERAGTVTSGSYAPSIGRNVGMAYVPAEHAGIGQEIEVVIRGRSCRAEIVRKPFYRRP